MLRRWALVLLPLLLIGCERTHFEAPLSILKEDLPPYLKGRGIAFANRSPWYVSVEPLSARRVGGSNSFGPPEETQPGSVKTSSQTTLIHYFDGIDAVPPGRASQGDAMLLHAEARESDRGQNVREAYVVLPRRALERASGTITLTADEKGVTTGGVYAGFVPWTIVAR